MEALGDQLLFFLRALAAVPFAIFAFLTRIASRAPDFFKIPADGLSEVGFRIEI